MNKKMIEKISQELSKKYCKNERFIILLIKICLNNNIVEEKHIKKEIENLVCQNSVSKTNIQRTILET